MHTGPVGHGPDAPPSTGASPRTAAPPARTDCESRSVPCPRNTRGAAAANTVTLPQEPGNDRRPFSSARPRRVLRTLTSSSGRRSGPGHGLPPAARAAVTIVEGNLFPVPAQYNTPLVPRQRRERGSFLREARSRSREGVGFPAFIFLPHKNYVFEPVWKTGRRCFLWSGAIAVFRVWGELDAAPKAGTQSMLAARTGPWGVFSRSHPEVVTSRPISGVMSARSCGITPGSRPSGPLFGRRCSGGAAAEPSDVSVRRGGGRARAGTRQGSTGRRRVNRRRV